MEPLDNCPGVLSAESVRLIPTAVNGANEIILPLDVLPAACGDTPTLSHAERILERAETEARSIERAMAAGSGAPVSHSGKSAACITVLGTTLVSFASDQEKKLVNHDLKSADEEVRYNVREVQWFNEKLTASEAEAHSINERWNNGGRESLEQHVKPVRDFGLVMSIIEVVREPLVVLDSGLMVCKANRAFYRTFGGSEKDTEQQSIYALSKGAWAIPSLIRLLEEARLDYRAYEELEVDTAFSSLGRKTLRINVRRLSGEDMVLMSIRDVTPRRQTEGELQQVREELRQGQKMEIVGRLAGGVAHDFNNLLTGILGFSELLVAALEKGSVASRQAIEIRNASERGASLTQQLLAFSRRQVLRPQNLSLNTVILELDQMLRRLIGENIQLTTTFDAESGSIRADPGQISQVILNLTVNARDAMTSGGELSIRTQDTVVEEGGIQVRGLPQGTFVTLTVTDSGTGMDQETQQHIFEPFFTTKPQGSGTGLGLATVFGIVNQSGGHLSFFSEPGAGTTFWIDFPQAEGSARQIEPPKLLEVHAGTETILVVEDDEMVRNLVTTILSLQGYTVLDVPGPRQALELCQSYSSPIDLVLTDLLMPGSMNGRELTEQLMAIRKGTRVLLMSGYTTDALMLYGVDERAPFLQKPFSVQQLAGKVREVLDCRLMNAN